MTDPWAFGWTQLLTIFGMIITVIIALGGFRTFGRWKREKLEERKIEIAFEALSLAYESKFIFQNIRSPMASGHEWKDMPERPGETEHERNSRGGYYASAKRIHDHRDFFERLFRIQPRVMALFGAENENVFLLIHQARRTIEVAALMLAERVGERHEPNDDSTKELYEQMRVDLWAAGAQYVKEGDRVGRQLQLFNNTIEALCRPVIDREYGRKPRTGVSGAIAEWLGI
jgi:hypothetical protein